MLRKTNSPEIGDIPIGVFSYWATLKIVTSIVNGAMSLLSICYIEYTRVVTMLITFGSFLDDGVLVKQNMQIIKK